MEEMKNGAAAPADNGAAKGTVKYKCEVSCYDNERLFIAEREYEFEAGKKPFRPDYFTKL